MSIDLTIGKLDLSFHGDLIFSAAIKQCGSNVIELNIFFG